MNTPQPNNRRKFLTLGLAGITTGAISSKALAGETKQAATPSEIEGPFYPTYMQKDRDFDLTQIEGHDEPALGDVIFIEGQVVDTDGQPIEDATVDLWQANAAGRYRHPHDSNTAPLDPNFQGWAIVPSGKNGEFRFKTIFPGTYPAAKDWMRPPHIHFKVSKLGFVELTTQMYFEGAPLNEKDFLIQRKSEAEQKLMIANKTSDHPATYRYRITLEKA